MPSQRTISLAILLALGAAAAAGSAAGAGGTPPERGTASASATVVRPIAVSLTAVLNFGKCSPAGSTPYGYVTLPAAPPSTRTTQNASLPAGDNSTPLILSVSGEPGRAYRISVPSSAASSPGNYVVANFTVWTQNSGDVSTSQLANFGSSGSDTVRVGATIAIPHGIRAQAYTAQVPVGISYE